MTRARSSAGAVPCAGCTACCRGEIVVLDPAAGDDPARYDTIPIALALDGKPGRALRRTATGDCVYLGPAGCTIHGDAPAMCRAFDCRLFYLGRAGQRDDSAHTKRLMAAGLARLHTLPQAGRGRDGKV